MIIFTNEKQYKIKNISLYIILWAAGFIVGAVIIILWNRVDRSQTIAVFNNLDEVTAAGTSDNIVNDLLLSANELNIYGSSSLIEYSDKSGQDKDAGLYEQILKNKLKKLKQKQESIPDFSVKPVPR